VTIARRPAGRVFCYLQLDRECGGDDGTGVGKDDSEAADTEDGGELRERSIVWLRSRLCRNCTRSLVGSAACGGSLSQCAGVYEATRRGRPWHSHAGLEAFATRLETRCFLALATEQDRRARSYRAHKSFCRKEYAPQERLRAAATRAERRVRQKFIITVRNG
jgi:hypothetical protein